MVSSLKGYDDLLAYKEVCKIQTITNFILKMHLFGGDQRVSTFINVAAVFEDCHSN